MEDGKSLASRKSPPPASGITWFPGQCPGTDTLALAQPSPPLQRHPSSSHTMGMLPPPLQLPYPLNPQPGPDSQPLEWSKAENNHHLLPRQGRLDRQAALGCILVHTHVCTGTQTCTHAYTHTETCTRTHPSSLPPSIINAAPSIFCAFALPM